MTNELIVFTHNDLDALGCALNLEYKWPTIPKKYFHTNYANIDQRVDEIEAYIKENGNTHIVIPDVSFSDNKDSLRRLYNLGKCTHIDHHLYPEGFWDEFPNMKVVWDKSKCATKLCNEYLGNTGKNVGLDKLTYIIDVYDLWQTNNEAFDFSQDLNEYFWKNDIAYLCNEIVANDFKLPQNFNQVVSNIRHTYEEAIENYEKRKLIYRADDITIAFINDWFNQVLVRDMKNGQNIVVGANSYGIIRIRIKAEAPYTDAQKNALRLELTGTENIGHMNAFTYKMKDAISFNHVIKEVEKIVGTIQKLMKG